MRVFASLVLVALVACSAPAGDAGGASPMFPDAGRLGATPIKHIVIIVQENRTVDNLFNGFPHADTRRFGMMGTQRVALKPVSLISPTLNNNYYSSKRDVANGAMTGFPRLAFGYVIRTDVAPYWTMAQRYTLADHMFPTTHGSSWSAHVDLIASTTNLSRTRAMVDFPSVSPYDCEAPVGTLTPTIDLTQKYDKSGPFPCFTQLRTMADTLDAAHVTWRFYAPDIQSTGFAGAWSSFGTIRSVRYGPDWQNVITPPPTILRDIDAGTLAGVTWVVPDWNYSDHAGFGDPRLGPSWVAAVVNKIGTSQFWDSTAIFVLWDDFGGWYDHVPPPQLDFKGLGIRVPCIVISPYVPAGSVVHTQYEFGSVLKFVEETFHLPALGTVKAGYSDARAASMLDIFDFARKPRPFQTIPAPVFPDVFVHMKPSERVPDDDD